MKKGWCAVNRTKTNLILLLAIVVLLAAGCESSVSNQSPVGGAKSFVKAMVNHDANLMKKINHSHPLFYPPQHCLEMATRENWSQYRLDQFQYKDLGNGKVEVTFPDGKEKMTLEMVNENGRWYFSGLVR